MRRLYIMAGMLVGLAALMLWSAMLLAQPAGAQLPPSHFTAGALPPQPKHTTVDVCTYAVSASTGAVIDPGTTDTGNSCDDCTTTITLPFAYQLYDLSFTAAHVSSNGNIQFVSNSPRSANTCLPAIDFDYTIFAQWGDLVTNCFGCGIFTSVSGTAPNRIFNIEWRAAFFEGVPVDFEVRLFEGTPRFDIIYGSIPSNGASATVGVQKSQVAGPVTQYECNTVGTLSDGMQLSFTPAVCATPTSTSTPAATYTPTRTPTRAPCHLCPAITNVSISCNDDGTVSWTATVNNRGSCSLSSPWKAQLQKHKRGDDEYQAVMSSHGAYNFPPGLTTLTGKFCYNAPDGVDLIRGVFSLAKDDQDGPNGGSADRTIVVSPSSAVPNDEDDCAPRMKSASIPPCRHSGSCPR